MARSATAIERTNAEGGLTGTPMFSHFLRKLSPFGSRRVERRVTQQGRVWHLTPAAKFVFDAPDLARWIADGSAIIVKSNPARIVYRVTLPTATIFVKHCRITGPRAWAREVLRPAKAKLEFENARLLAERGIAAVEPLAWGHIDSVWPGESFLITRAEERAISFLEFAERVLPTAPLDAQPAMRRQLAHGLGEFLAAMHEAGVAHPDPHAGNLLVEWPADGIPRFVLIDLHAVRIGSVLSWRESRANLTLFNRWFQMRVTRSDRHRFWCSYFAHRFALRQASSAKLAREVECATLRSNLGFWAGRQSRCLGTNRYFRQVKRNSLRGHVVRDLPEAALQALLPDPDAIFNHSDVKLLKDSRTSTVAAFTLITPTGPLEVVLKRVNIRKWHEPLKNRLRRSPVLRSWMNGHTLRDRWLPTPRPLAAFHRYRRGLPAEGYLLTELVPAACDLDAAVPVEELPRLIRAMHDRAVSHRDLKAANILLREGSPVFIDLVGVRVGRVVGFRQRCRELARLNASFLTPGQVTRSQRLRFLRSYLAAGSRLHPGWKSWWQQIALETAAKVEKNRRSGRPLA